MLTLFVTMLAILAGYGYVFINSQTECELDLSLKAGDLYTIPALLVTTSASTLVLAAIAYICIETGYKGRMEQFITYEIRRKYYGTEEALLEIFPQGYTPFKNDRSWLTPIQYPYDTFFHITTIAVIIINLATIVRVLCCACNCGCCCCAMVPLIYIQLLTSLAFIIAVIYCLKRCYTKYLYRAFEYKSKANKEDKQAPDIRSTEKTREIVTLEEK